MLFQYCLQAKMEFDGCEFRNIGVMIWSDSVLGYYGLEAYDDHVQDMCGRIRDSRDCGRTIEEFVEYFRERHGGLYYSMSRPHDIQADTVEDAVRLAGERWDLDFLVPEPDVPLVDTDLAQALLNDTEMGFDLYVHGGDYQARGRGFAMAVGSLGNSAVIGYLPFPYSFSELSRGRYWLKSLERIQGVWLASGHDNWNWELGILDIEIRPIRDLDILYDIAGFIDSLSKEQRITIENRLKKLGDAMLL